jgi:hypothetical protein
MSIRVLKMVKFIIFFISFFQVSEPTYLSDHAQIAVHIKCDIIENNHKYDEHSNTIYLKSLI